MNKKTLIDAQILTKKYTDVTSWVQLDRNGNNGTTLRKQLLGDVTVYSNVKPCNFLIVPKFGRSLSPPYVLCAEHGRSTVPVCHTTWHHIPDVNNLNFQHRVNYRSPEAT